MTEEKKEREQDEVRNRMSIFLTPLNAEGQEGETSKPNRFIVSFMHPKYDPRKYGFEKFELELDAGAERGKLKLIRGMRNSKFNKEESDNFSSMILEDRKPFGAGILRTIREYVFEEFCTTPMGIRFDNCVRI